MKGPGETCDDIVAAIDRALGEDGSVAEGQHSASSPMVYDGERITDPATSDVGIYEQLPGGGYSVVPFSPVDHGCVIGRWDWVS